MDAKPSQPPSQPLKYQTWFLKVSIHCEGCRRKVKKVLKSIDGVFTATIDPLEQKVTVTGSVGVETLLRKLVRAGKHAEVWPEENLDGNGKSSGKAKKNKNKNNEPKETQSLQNKGITESVAKCESQKKSSSNSKTGAGAGAGDSTGNSPAAGNHVSPEGGGGGSGKKKKKKDQGGGGNGNGSNVGLSPASKGAPSHTGFQFQNPTWQGGVGQQQVNISPTRQQSFFSYYPEIGYPPMFYVAAYNNRLYNYPMGGRVGPSYYVPPSPYMCAGLDQDGSSSYQFQSAPLVSSFEIFSDENANGCSIM